MTELAALTIRDTDGALALTGRELGSSDWFEVDQDRVDGFADAANDWHWAHNDPARAAVGPFGVAIGHAHLTLSLLPCLLGRVLRIDDGGTTMFYGYNRVRFPAPVPVGGRIRLRGRVERVAEVGGAVQLTVDLTVEIAGVDRPGCVAQGIWRHYPIGPP